MEVELVCLIEELAANAWPAAVNQAVDGWRLRFNWGVTARANSVLPNGQGGVCPLEARLAEAELFYVRRNAPPRFQVCAAAQPADLDAVLAGRGYRAEQTTCVQLADVARLLAPARPGQDCAVQVGDELGGAWLDVYAQAGAMQPRERAMRQGILERIGPRAGFALATVGGRPAAVGLGVIERGWLGVFCMETLPEFRRRGVAASILAALAAWAGAHGAQRAYLQVVEANQPATALYARAGFQTLYRYHYRVM